MLDVQNWEKVVFRWSLLASMNILGPLRLLTLSERVCHAVVCISQNVWAVAVRAWKCREVVCEVFQQLPVSLTLVLVHANFQSLCNKVHFRPALICNPLAM